MTKRINQMDFEVVAEKFINDIRHQNNVAASTIIQLKDLTEDEYRMLVYRLVDSFGMGFDVIGQLTGRLYETWKYPIVSGTPRPPANAEYLLLLLLPREEGDFVIGDLIEGYGRILRRFNKRRADIWFYKQVVGSFLPLMRRALLRAGALIWLGRILRRLVS